MEGAVKSEGESGSGSGKSRGGSDPHFSLSKGDLASRLQRTRTHLTTICVLLVLYSVLFFVIDPPRSEHGQPNEQITYVNPFCLAFVPAFFLWRRMAFGRNLAIGLTWLLLLGAGFTLLEVFPLPFMTVHGRPVFPGVSPTVLRIGVIPLLLAQIWQLRVLKRPETILLVSSSYRAQQSAAATGNTSEQRAHS